MVNIAGQFQSGPIRCPISIWSDGGLPSDGCWNRSAMRRTAPLCSLVHRVSAVQGCFSGQDGCPRQGWKRYSRKVPQRTWTRVDLRGRGRTVTCTDGRGWTCCRQMACKRSAVRARLAPPGQRRNSNRSNRQYSSKVPQRRPGWAAVRVFGSGMFPGWDCWHDAGFQALNRRWQACYLGESPPCRSRDSCHPVRLEDHFCQ